MWKIWKCTKDEMQSGNKNKGGGNDIENAICFLILTFKFTNLIFTFPRLHNSTLTTLRS